MGSESYGKLSKAIGIHILNFSCIKGQDKYHNRFIITEQDSNQHYFKDLELHTIELQKFADNLSDELSDLVDKIKTSLDIWVSFLTKYDLLSKSGVPQNMQAQPIDKALHILEVMNLSTVERNAYEDHLKWMRDQASTVERVRENSFAEGEAKGRAEGEAKGAQEKASTTAKKMLEKGSDINFIAECTGLSISEIEKIKCEISTKN